MTNGSIEKIGNDYFVKPAALDETGKRTTISVYASIGGESRLMGTTPWRVKRVPDPVAQIAGQAGGNIRKERLKVEEGILAVLEDFDFDFKYTITKFQVQTSTAEGYTNIYPSNSNRFTQEQKAVFNKLSTNSIIYIDNIVARGDDGSERPLDPISFKIQ